MNDDFSTLRAIASQPAQNSDKIFWKFPEHGDLMGTIVDFNQFENARYGGTQYTIEVKLADTGEIASAFMNDYLCKAMDMNHAEIGDKILIRFLGMDATGRFNRFSVHFDKPARENKMPYFK